MQPRDTIFVCVVIARIRPCTTAGLPIGISLHGNQRFYTQRIEERIPLVESSRNVDDDRDDDMSETTHTMNTGRRKVDETAKELQAPLPRTLLPLMRVHHDLMTKRTSSPHALRNKPESQKTKAKAHQDVSFLFLQARIWPGNA